MTDTPQTKLYVALLAAMRDFGKVKKDRQNPAFRSSYATLHSILEAVEGPLNDQGLILVQRLADEGGLGLITELIHAESGQRLACYAPIVCAEPNNPQKVGSAITYYRRYSLLTLLNLTPEEDDDGNHASKPAAATSAPVRNAVAPARTPTSPAQQHGAQALPAVSPLDSLLARIRDDNAQPEFRRKALHTYYLTAESLDDLDQCQATVALSGVPTDDLRKAYDWHARRMAAALAPPAPAAPRHEVS